MSSAKRQKLRRLTPAQAAATAYHEAGHAVAALCLHLPIKHVTIVPENDTHGHIQIRPPFRRSDNPEFDRSDRLRLKLETYAIFCLAGLEAQRKFRPSSARSYHWHQDYVHVLDYLDSFAEDNDEVQVWLRLLRIRARNLIATHWALVEALAAALMERKRLSGDEVRGVLFGRKPLGLE
jgi:ATP-dependent Zn protease